MSLNAEGILEGIPGNDDVGELNLLVTATDKGGMQSVATLHLSVGNINNPPSIQHDIELLNSWTRSDLNGKLIYSREILLRDKLEIALLDKDIHSETANALFSDPDSKHELQELRFELSSDGVNWSDSVNGLAVIIENIIQIEATSKNIVGDNTLFVRALDNHGASTIQEFHINVKNVNDAPRVRPSAVLIGGNQ